ncbi:MAG: creatininase family protein [Myxococcota bacterium]
MNLSDLTYVEAEEIIRAGAVALWPAGATESHGPHLPLGTDVIIAEHTCRRAAAEIRASLSLHALVLPALSLSVTDFARPFRGTLSVRRPVVTAYARDVLLSSAEQGFRCVCIVNAHLEPEHRYAMRDAVAQAREESSCPVVMADPCDRRWVPELTDEFQSGACHGGRYESSLVMNARPDLVREEQRLKLVPSRVDLIGEMKAGKSNFQQMGAEQSYFGDPARATSTEGDESYGVLARIVVRVIQEALAE